MSQSTDPFLVAAVMLLAGLGLVTLFSASSAFAERFFGDSLYFIKRQAVFACVGFVLFIVASRINLSLVRRFIKPLVLGTVVLCLLTFIPGIGVVKNGAARWIRLGTSTYQPSEMVKLVLPLYLAHIFDKKEERLSGFSDGILPPILMTLLFFMLIYLQNNFSTAAFIGMNAVIIFFLAGIRFRFFIAAAFVSLPIAALLVLTREHRLRRVMAFLKPEWDPLGAGYQVRSSILTIASGGIWGKGIGQGTRKIASVPEIHSDFVFSAYAEEAGLVGVVLFFALLALLCLRGYRAALAAPDTFRRLLACGLVTMFITQALLNTGVVVGALPATGVPLPFFSAGGSSLATMLFAAGLIVNVSRTAARSEDFDV
jgi:cell division protein FtsW